MKVIFAQGNPEKRYETTRHNIGWIILDVLTSTLGAEWKKDKKHNADIATVTLDGEKTLLVKPLSYYNETGLVARSILQFYKLNAKEDFIALHDDLALPFGTIRIREKGSDAGNNGIKSLNAHLGSDYTRIRIGIWNELRTRMGDADFVLASFSKEEQAHIKDTLAPHVIAALHAFRNGSLTPQSFDTKTA